MKGVMIKKGIGWSMLTVLFGGLFIVFVNLIGVKATSAIYGLVAGVAIWTRVSVILIIPLK